jgi:hypothetical protein
MIEETMSTMTIVFILIILLFGFDSTGQVKSAGITITAKQQLELGDSRKKSENFLKSRSSDA